MEKEKLTAYDVALQELHAVAKVMNLSDEVVGFLSSHRRTLEVSIPVRMDDGTMKYFKGYRCQHNNALGPTRGGTRLHKDETMDDVKALSFWMTIKNSLAGIPSGGAKGGIAVDPNSLSKDELQRLCRSYVKAIYPMISPNVDVFGPDIGTPPQVMTWFLDEYENIVQRHEPTAFSGKPIILGGSRGRDKATGYGLVYGVKELLKQNGESLVGKTIAIQGFGNLGAFAAEAFINEGAIVIAAMNSRGGAYNKNGIDVAKAQSLVANNVSLNELEGCEQLASDAIWSLDCDILVPAALQNQVTEDNADSVKAKYIIEGANGPLTPAAEEILLEKGTIILPDIAANFGGVLVSYFEQVQNRYCLAWPAEDVYKRLEEKVTQTTAEVWQVAKEKNVSLRIAAWVLALNKVIEAMQLRGWVK